MLTTTSSRTSRHVIGHARLNDSLTGAAGDTLTGGGGNDKFVFGEVTVTDFRSGDEIVTTVTAPTQGQDLSDVGITVAQVDSDVTITIGGTAMTLKVLARQASTSTTSTLVRESPF